MFGKKKVAAAERKAERAEKAKREKAKLAEGK